MITRKKIMVTGSDGQLGKELQQLSSLFPVYDFVFLSKNDLDISDNKNVRDFFEKERPQYLINCAAYTEVDKAESEKDIAFRINADAAANLAELCGQYGSLFLHVSTDYVFDGSAVTSYRENDPVNPTSIYGESKWKGEQLISEKNPEAIIIRTSWLYSEHGRNFVKTMLRLMSEKKELKVVNDQVGSPTWAADLAETILQIIMDQQWKPGIYHFSNDGEISWYEFALAIKKITGSSCIIHPIPTTEYPTPAKRPAFSVLDKTRIQETFGIRLKHWEESLRECLSRIDLQSDVN